MGNGLIFLIILITFFHVAQAHKGDVSVSAGPLLSFGTKSYPNVHLKTGLSLEASVQYNFTDRSAAVAEAGFGSFSIKNRLGSDSETRYHKSINSFKIVYRYIWGNRHLFKYSLWN